MCPIIWVTLGLGKDESKGSGRSIHVLELVECIVSEDKVVHSCQVELKVKGSLLSGKVSVPLNYHPCLYVRLPRSIAVIRAVYPDTVLIVGDVDE